MDNEYTRKLQLKLLEIMQVFHEVCLKHNITYYMLGGTMLGAVRHKGFIPWDDDMDVGLPRDEYDRLLNLPQKEWPSNIKIKTPYNSKDVIFPYSKIMDTNTTLIEDRLDGIVEGIYIDVFPLDGAGNNFISAKLRYIIHYWNQGLLYNNQDHGEKRTVLRRLVQRYARKQDVKELYSKTEKWMRNSSYDKSSIVANYSGAYGFKELTPKKAFGVPVLFDFEGLKLYGVNMPDKFLTSLYGNYMEFPPVEKRKSHHRFKYINLALPFNEYIKE